MVLYYLDGKSVSEVAEALRTSETAVRQRLFEARKQVRKEVAQFCAVVNCELLT